MDEVRIGDDERERTAQALSRHLADGRLTLDEFEDRLGQAYKARTPSELAPVLRDLPALAAPPSVRAGRERRTLPPGLVGWIALSVVLLSVWALAGFGFPWPIFPILATAPRSSRPTSASGWGMGAGWGCSSTRLSPGTPGVDAGTGQR